MEETSTQPQEEKLHPQEQAEVPPIKKRKRLWGIITAVTGFVSIFAVAAYSTAANALTEAVAKTVKYPNLYNESTITEATQSVQVAVSVIVIAGAIFSIALIAFIAADLLDAYRQSPKA